MGSLKATRKSKYMNILRKVFVVFWAVILIAYGGAAAYIAVNGGASLLTAAAIALFPVVPVLLCRWIRPWWTRQVEQMSPTRFWKPLLLMLGSVFALVLIPVAAFCFWLAYHYVAPMTDPQSAQFFKGFALAMGCFLALPYLTILYFPVGKE